MGVPVISYSTDHGVTWRAVQGEFGVGQISDWPYPFRLFWGHAGPGAPDVLIAARLRNDGTGWDVWRADMSAAQPAFVQESSDPFGPGSAVGFADSATGSHIVRVSAAGELSAAPLTARGRITFGPTEVGGLPTPPRTVRLGGVREQAAPPDGVVVVGGSGPFTAQVLTKAQGATTFAGAAASQPTQLAADCGFGLDASGPTSASASIAPTTTTGAGAGTVASCWFRMSAGAPLATTALQIGIGRDGLAYDADWGRGNHVAYGSLQKLAALDAGGVPVVPAPLAQGTGGTDPSSAGYTVNGIRGAAVQDTAYGPAGASQIAVAANAAFASADGGATMTRLVDPGFWTAQSVDWWRGASGTWLVNGFGVSCSNLLSAQRDWDGASSLARPNVAGTACADLGGSTFPSYGVMSLAGVRGTDTVFIGVGDAMGSASSPRHTYRARLVPGDPPALADRLSFDAALAGIPLYEPRAMAYCPASSADPRMRDVLWIASGVHQQPALGSLVRITGASTDAPVATQVASVPHDVAQTALNDVRADCATGIAYAGGAAEHDNRSMAQVAGLYRSSDGGVTFSRVPLPVPASSLQIEYVTAIGLQPGNPQDVTVAVDDAGTTLHSTDGGTTWTTVNDPTTARPARVNDIEFPPAAGSSASSRVPPLLEAGRLPLAALAAQDRDALVGTSNGAYRADLSVSRGILGLTGRPGGSPTAGVRVTTAAGDGDPAQSGAVRAFPRAAVVRRVDGLYLSEATEGGWWTPVRIPRTRRGDGLPAVERDTTGRLIVSFARTRGGRGVFVTTRGARGTWSVPRRVAAVAGDTRPAVAVTGATTHVVFLRTRGRRGLYDAVAVGGRWRAAVRLPGTTAADAVPSRGGPVLAVRAGVVHLAFTRAGSGIHHARTRAGRWETPVRLTRGGRDTAPAIALTSARRATVVFRRPGTGLVAVTGVDRWTERRVTGTTARDTDPSLTIAANFPVLAFARPGGTRPGVFVSRATPGEGWLPPRRWSRSARDRHPAVRAFGAEQVAVVLDRG